MRWTHTASFVLGAALATVVTAGAGGERPGRRFATLDVFAGALATIERNYVEHVDEQKLMWGASRGMTLTLDPHSAFLTPDDLAELRQDTEGEFGGVGLSLVPDGGTLLVRDVLPGTPAEKAGIVTGDRVLAVDGSPVVDLEGGVGKLRGKVGEPVTLTVDHAGSRRDLQLVREVIHVQAVKLRALRGGMVLVTLAQFQDRVGSEVGEAISRYAREHGKPAGVILDLRGNPGGLLDEAIAVADVFLPEGVVVSTRGRDGVAGDVGRSSSGDPWDGIPLVVLVDAGTASAAEIVAGALQDRHRARIVGQRSYGKGSVQSVFPLGDGSALKLTVSRYYTPAGRSIQEHGITPDVEVAPDPAEARAKVPQGDREENLPNHLGNRSGEGAHPAVPRPVGPQGAVSPPSADPDKGPDKQLDAAMDVLTGEIHASH